MPAGIWVRQLCMDCQKCETDAVPANKQRLTDRTDRADNGDVNGSAHGRPQQVVSGSW